MVSDPKGSIWRKWDLHFHTPSSYDYQHKGATNQEIVEALVKAGVEVVAITDHHRIDVARIVELQKLGGDRLTVLPGIELRSELGGSNSVHFIGIFPEGEDVADIWTKLSGKLDITEAEVKKRGDDSIYCPFVNAAKVIHELGGIVTVHAGAKSNSIEELKNSDYIKQIVKKDLVRDCIDIYEVGKVSDIPGYQEKVFPHLDRPLPLIICSDNHDIRNYDPAQPSLWIKGDKCFEALRQTLYEPGRRVTVGVDKPIEPLLGIRKVSFNFPEDARLTSSGDEDKADTFCFRGKTEIVFSPYLTCLVGGRGSGKSTLLNLIHEKLEPGTAKFFSDNRLIPSGTTSIPNCVVIDDDTEKKVVEFLQQNEIEQFATSPLGLTDAIFHRLGKLDSDGKLAAVEAELSLAKKELELHAARITENRQLSIAIVTSEKELASAKALVSSFENAEYKAINTDLGNITRELQALRNWRTRLEILIADLTSVAQKQNFPASSLPNEYEVEFFNTIQAIKELTVALDQRANLKNAGDREAQLAGTASAFKKKLEEFLTGRGLSQENLADVGKANERAARIEQELPGQKGRAAKLAEEIKAFKNQRELIQKRADTVAAALAPLNKTLAQLSKEVRAIELRYEFDKTDFVQAMTKHVQESLGKTAPRIDHIQSVLEDVDFTNLTTTDGLLSKLPSKQATAKAIADYYNDPLAFELLKIEAEKKLMDYESFGRIRVSYDGKAVENSSFGQRCTAAIVILLLLGNEPIVIDEPEAHLDSSLIANYLVELVKTAKPNRQIIFATHNANFVVNGDTELIHALEMGADKRTKITSFTIENMQQRDKLLALEGGSEAFRKREHRYGI